MNKDKVMPIDLLDHTTYVESHGMEMIPTSIVRAFLEEQTKELESHVDTFKELDQAIKEVGQALGSLHNKIDE